MTMNLYVFHQDKSSLNSKELSSLEVHDWKGIYFETCLRKIWITNKETDLKKLESLKLKALKTQIFKNELAYSFLLEVLCGLKSPVIGETEVFGQFKNQVLKNISPESTYFKFVNQLVEDTKKIRKDFLIHLGCQSYGSLTRKYLSGFSHADILGAGEFVQSLKPWIEKLEIKTKVFTRDISKYKNIFDPSPLELKSLSDFDPNYVIPENFKKSLIICAPINSKDIDVKSYHSVIDFRDNSSIDKFNHKSLKTLAQIFDEVKKGSLVALEKKEQALKRISIKASKYYSQMNHRPFGWDDICA